MDAETQATTVPRSTTRAGRYSTLRSANGSASNTTKSAGSPSPITVPDGWETFDGASLGKDDPDLLNSWNAALLFYPVTSVPRDACAGKDALVQIDPTAEAFVEAMAAQKRSTSRAVEVMVGDYAGLEFGHAARSDVDATNCDDNVICMHSDVAQNCTGTAYESVAWRETYRAVDLNGERAVIVLVDESIDPALRKEARAVFDSIVFVKPDE